MKLAYQVATPELNRGPEITAYQQDLEQGFRLLHECGYKGVEFMIRDTKTQDLENIKRMCAQYDLEICMLCTGEIWAQEHISLSDINDENRERCIRLFKDMIDFAAIFGAQVNIGRVRGTVVPGVPYEVTLARAVDAFRQVAEYAGERGVIVILEPVNRIQCNFINTTAEGREVVDLVNHPNFKIMLDMYHMNVEDKDMIEEIYKSKGYFTYVHLCDSNRLYPGNCNLDFPKIMAALKDVGYDGWASAEIFQVPDDETAVRKSAEHMLPLL